MRLQRIPTAVLRACRELEISDGEIERMSPKELFEKYCQNEGLIGYSYSLWQIVTELSTVKVTR